MPSTIAAIEEAREQYAPPVALGLVVSRLYGVPHSHSLGMANGGTVDTIAHAVLGAPAYIRKWGIAA